MTERRTAFTASLAILAVALASVAGAQQAVTLEQIMAHPDWLGRAPERPYWGDDSKTFYYWQKRLDQEERDLFRGTVDGEIELVPLDERGAVDAASDRYNGDRSLKVFVRHGDLFLKDVATGDVHALTRTVEVEAGAFFTRDGQVAYRRGDTFLVRDLDSGLEAQPFDVRFDDDPEEALAKEIEEASYLEEQQRRLFDTLGKVRERREQRRLAQHEQEELDPSHTEPPWYLGDKLKLVDAALAPSLRYLLLSVTDKKAEAGKVPQMPHYVTDSGYVETEEVRPKVGSQKPIHQQLILLDRETHKLTELDYSVLPAIDVDPLADLREASKKRQQENAESEPANDPGTAAEAETESLETPTKPVERPLEVADLLWNKDGSRAVVQLFSRDNKDRWIALVDPEEEPPLKPLLRIHDEAWINWSFRDLGWLHDDETVYYLSEESGYSHLHLVSTTDGKSRQLTSGAWVVSEPSLTLDDRYFYFRANKEHPTVFEIYRVALDSGVVEAVTDLGGMSSASLSPDDKQLLILHSKTTQPPELYLQDATPGASARKLTDTTSVAFSSVPWVAPEIVEVPSSHVARPLYARLYQPDRSRGKRAAVVFVHGAGYLQNAHQGWSSYFREFMFHTFLAQHGYVVLDMDYRGSAGYGRDWRTAIYRQMGTPEVEDLEDGVRWLARTQNVDAKRVGVYGGSYGGFLTFMALFKKPDLFAAGAALRPVTDWAHYNHPYTSNILNTPDVDAEAYERSSAIEFAAGLEKPLLICTGMLDNNVLFQDSVRLVQRLIELGKEDWEIAIYPMESHGFIWPASWLDEYRRIWKLFDTHLRR